MNLSRFRSQSVDDEEHFGCHHCCRHTSSMNSDSEYSGSVSVRDMIRRYDNQMATTAARSTNTPIHPKGLSRRPHSDHVLCDDGGYVEADDDNDDDDGVGKELQTHKTNGKHFELSYAGKRGVSCCKHCNACRCCQNRSRKSSTSIAIQSVQSCNENLANLNAKDVAVQNNMNSRNTDDEVDADVAAGGGVGGGGGGVVGGWLEFKDDSTIVSSTQLNAPNIGEKNRLPTTPDPSGEATCYPIESSYQSKTTIAKTASGVRIIIDIFFDQEQQCVNASDVLGSRVETDIPQSRILSEFQQQTRAVSVTSFK